MLNFILLLLTLLFVHNRHTIAFRSNVKSVNIPRCNMKAILERVYGNDFDDDTKNDLVLDDFNHILDAIYTYKRVYGDLRIPIKVVISHFLSFVVFICLFYLFFTLDSKVRRSRYSSMVISYSRIETW